ncbi:MAG: universal stress protein [Gammaproteobacteria bacterium]|nr:universal stress protein [Gammaproteobacteria bacterium]
MSLYRRILVPVDNSSAAQAGLSAAIALAQDQQATLKLVAVANEAIKNYAGGELGWIEPQGLGELIKTDSEASLDKAEQQAADAGLTPERELIVAQDGHVGRHIVQAAVDWQADLIVIGTHGRQGFSLWLAGSTTETLLHGLSVPLLVVPGKQADKGD